MEAVVEMPVESDLQLRLLGPLTMARGRQPVVLPPSRKVRALVAYQALSPQAVARRQLCELLWDLPNDPRGELRWALSKARALLDAPGRPRLLAEGDALRLDREGLAIDVLTIDAALHAGLATLDATRLRMLAATFGGDFLEGVDIERSTPWSAWLIGRRRHYRAARVAILEQLARALPPDDDEALDVLEQWLQLAPFERRAHEAMLEALARRGRLREGDEHLAATARQFEAESQDWAPLGHAWRAARLHHAPGLTALAVQVPDAGLVLAPADAAAPALQRRASIAVMPFAEQARGVAARGGLADGLVHDVITRLAKLRSVFVIAQGTVFALDARNVGAEDAGRALDVDYVASGSLRRDAGQVSVNVQLADTRSNRIVWAEVFATRLGDPFEVLDEIGNRIVGSIASQIEVAERNRAILKAPNSLDAWEAYHRGLWHMVRFNDDDNLQARRYFEQAVRLDPGFARPYAGLSFTHFQDAFLGWAEREPAVEAAYRSASQGLLADDLDPAGHWALGRAQWLRGRLGESLAELDTSVALSPNFALGHYTLAFVHAQSGDPRTAIRASDHSRDLSPFDPMLFAMLAARAMALMRLGRHDEAADWAMKAAARPNAHVHVVSFAAHSVALAGRIDEARALTASVRRQRPGYGIDDFLKAFRFDEDAERLMRGVAPRIAAA